MIFDEICKNIDFELYSVDGEWEWVIDNFHIASLVNNKKKISFVDLMNAYEDDEENVDMTFMDDNSGYHTMVSVYFHEDGDLVATLLLKSKYDTFNSLLSKYCSN